MRVLEKILLLLLVVILLLAGAAMVGVCFMSQSAVFYHAEWLLTELFHNRWLVLVAGGVLLLLGVLLFFGVVCARSRKTDERRAADVVKVGAGDSNVQISTAAVDCIIQQQKLKFPALMAIESRISDTDGGAQVVLKITAKAEANMQELSAGLQASVKSQLEEMVGLQVSVVKVIIADVAAAAN